MRLLKRLHRYVTTVVSNHAFKSARPDMEYIFTSDYYRSLSEKYASAEQYIDVLKELEKRSLYYTRKSIGAKMYFATPLEVVQRKHSLGKPVFSFTNENIRDIKLYFFKTELGGIRTGLEGHFFRNRLFMLSYVFPQINNASRLWIFNVLNDKYELNLNEQPANEIAIHDEQDNLLLLHESGTALHTVELTYLDRSNPFWKQAELEMVEQYEAYLSNFTNQEKDLYKKL